MLPCYYLALSAIGQASTEKKAQLVNYDSTPLYLEDENYGIVNLMKYEVYSGVYLENLWLDRYSIPILIEFLGPFAKFHPTSNFDPTLLRTIPIELFYPDLSGIIVDKSVPLIQAQAGLNDLQTLSLEMLARAEEMKLKDFVLEQAQRYGLLQVVSFVENQIRVM